MKELSVRLSAVSTNDAYEYERKMSVFAFNLRGMRLCTLTIMGTDVSVAFRIRIIQFNSIQFDATRFGMGRFDFDFDCDFTFQHIKSKLAISQSWAQSESPRPLPVLCIRMCVCQWQRIEEQKSLKSASGRAMRQEDKDECVSAVVVADSTFTSAVVVVIVSRSFQLNSNKKQPYASTKHRTPVATCA